MYVGEFVRGSIDGYGRIKKVHGDSFYVGGMKNNQKSGYGMERSASGWVVGQHSQDNIHGFCELYTTERICKYQGGVKKSAYEGAGMLLKPE